MVFSLASRHTEYNWTWTWTKLRTTKAQQRQPDHSLKICARLVVLPYAFEIGACDMRKVNLSCRNLGNGIEAWTRPDRYRTRELANGRKERAEVETGSSMYDVKSVRVTRIRLSRVAQASGMKLENPC